MFKAPPTSPTCEMTDRQLETETPDMIITTRIEFIQNENEARRIQRPMPEQLYGVMTEIDFEAFCDKIDLIFELYHESTATFDYRICRLLCFYLLFFPASAGLNFLSRIAGIPFYYVIQVQKLLFLASGIALFYIFLKHVYEHNALFTHVHAECLELTNRNGNATFLLETKYVKPEYSENSVQTFSHINVLINDTVQLKHDVTNNEFICSENC